jgi:uncharacterized protein (DUF924 family)
MQYTDVLDFWFNQLSPKEWFETSDSLDLKMVEKFIVIHSQAVAGELAHWRKEPAGRLAEIILIDQFSRNIYRDDPKAYTNDGMALVLAQEAISGNYHQILTPEEKQFLYMPFMHSESKVIHEEAMKLFSEPGLENNLKYERDHKAIIERFGRYPERNKILGRTNTPEEEKYLMENIPLKIQITESIYTQRH